jgi:hypothetical protein
MLDFNDILNNTRDLQDAPRRKPKKEEFDFYRQKVPKAVKPDFSTFRDNSKKFMFEFDGEMTPNITEIVNNLLDAMDDLEYSCSMVSRMEEPEFDSKILINRFKVFPSKDDDTLPYFTNPTNMSYYNAAWIMGKAYESESLYINTIGPFPRAIAATRVHTLLDRDLDNPVEFLLLYSVSGVTTPEDINWKLKEYNTSSAINFAHKLDIPIYNIGSRNGIKQFIAKLKLMQEKKSGVKPTTEIITGEQRTVEEIRTDVVNTPVETHTPITTPTLVGETLPTEQNVEESDIPF